VLKVQTQVETFLFLIATTLAPWSNGCNLEISIANEEVDQVLTNFPENPFPTTCQQHI